MTSLEPNRLGIHRLLANGDLADRGIVAAGLAFKIKFDRLLQIGHGLVPGSAEAGYLDIETLSNNELILPIEDVRDCLHGVKTTMQDTWGQRCSFISPQINRLPKTCAAVRQHAALRGFSVSHSHTCSSFAAPL